MTTHFLSTRLLPGYALQTSHRLHEPGKRGAIALRSLGQNTAAEALYVNTREAGDGQTLNGDKNWSITFPKGQLPPVDAFWSITMYNSEDFFVDSPINRYAIGNRSEHMQKKPMVR